MRSSLQGMADAVVNKMTVYSRGAWELVRETDKQLLKTSM